jgi:hypothetical protein
VWLGPGLRLEEVDALRDRSPMIVTTIPDRRLTLPILPKHLTLRRTTTDVMRCYRRVIHYSRTTQDAAAVCRP